MSRFIYERNIHFNKKDISTEEHVKSAIEREVGPEAKYVPAGLIGKLSGLELSCGQAVPFIVCTYKHGQKVVDVSGGVSYSIVLDLGTTNIVGVLVNNLESNTIYEESIANPQIEYGSDILTRMQVSMSGKYDEVRKVLIEGVNALVDRLCKKKLIKMSEVHCMIVTGNTAMSHYFLGHDVSTIPVAPYEPEVREPGFSDAKYADLCIHPEAVLYVFPNAGSYVGGDIISGILSSGIYRSSDTSVLIDVGTNAEVVIGNKDWLLVSAGAAGPALEDGISLVGKRAGKGIVYDINIGPDGAECMTFDDAAPEGICGSGMISLIYEMHRSDVISDDGTLIKGAPGVIEEEGCLSYKIPCSGNSDLSISQIEIDNFMRSKAAMITLLIVLLRSVGLQFRDICHLYVSGALGTGIDVRKAIGIGMLPGWPADIIEPLGNSALRGALMVLNDSAMLGEIKTIMEMITYRNMHDDPEFMKEFRGGMFIPHTNPSVLDV